MCWPLAELTAFLDQSVSTEHVPLCRLRWGYESVCQGALRKWARVYLWLGPPQWLFVEKGLRRISVTCCHTWPRTDIRSLHQSPESSRRRRAKACPPPGLAFWMILLCPQNVTSRLRHKVEANSVASPTREQTLARLSAMSALRIAFLSRPAAPRLRVKACQ